MKELFQYIGVVVVTVILIVGAATKLMPLTEEVRVVEPKPGVECAIASRLAIVSISCWEVAKEYTIVAPEESELYNKYTTGVYLESRIGERTPYIEEKTLSISPYSVVSIPCGDGEVRIAYGTGEVTFTEGCDPPKASKALWDGIKPLFDIEIRGGAR